MTGSSRVLFAHAAATVAALSAGTAVVATRFVIAETDPISLALYRYVIGSICFLPLLPFIWPRHKLPAAEIGKIAGLGILFFCLFTWGFNASLDIIPAARGAIGLATVPIQTLVIAALFGREVMTPRKFASVVLAFFGVTIAFGSAAFANPSNTGFIGDIYMLLGVLCAAIYSVFSRGSLQAHGSLFVTAFAMMFGAAALLVLSIVSEGLPQVPDLSSKGWMAVLFLGTFAGSIQFALFTYALRWLPPSTTVLYIALNPVTAMLFSALLIGETITLPLILGLIFVLTAIMLSSGMLNNLVWRVNRKESA